VRHIFFMARCAFRGRRPPNTGRNGRFSYKYPFGALYDFLDRKNIDMLENVPIFPTYEAVLS